MLDVKVSIAIPAYKSNYLGNAIQSVLNQTYKNLELIIVDDCSPEPIETVVKKFDDTRIHYYRNEVNIGGSDPVANWNKCLSYANGSYFSLLCDDDVYAPTFIEEMLYLAEKYPNTNVFRARVKVVDGDGKLNNFFPSAPEWESSTDYLWAIVSGYRLQTISEFMYPTSHIKQLGGYIAFPKAWCADHASVISFAKQGGIATCNNFLVQFRMSGLNISTNDSKNILEKVNAHIRYSNLIREFISDEDNDVRDLILKIRRNKIRDIITHLLVNANMEDFVFLYNNRNSVKYNIPSRCFMRAIYGKVAKMFKSNS